VVTPPQRLAMGCMGPCEEGTAPRSSAHPIASLCGGIAVMRSPITKIRVTSCADWDCEVPDSLEGDKAIGQQ